MSRSNNPVEINWEILRNWEQPIRVLPEDHECEHKWRTYDQIGTVCRDCGKTKPREL